MRVAVDASAVRAVRVVVGGAGRVTANTSVDPVLGQTYDGTLNYGRAVCVVLKERIH